MDNRCALRMNEGWIEVKPFLILERTYQYKAVVDENALLLFQQDLPGLTSMNP